MGTTPPTRIVHNAAESRYELHVSDTEGADETSIGIAEYRLAETPDGPVAEFHHTLIDPHHRGHGYAEQLVGAALDDVGERGLKVRATCWYVDQYLIENPAYADLRV